MIVVLLGFALRLWSWLALDRAGLSEDQKLRVQRPPRYSESGPYQIVQHPAYWGSMLVISGAGMMGWGWQGMLLALPAWPFFASRIAEENRLRTQPWP